LEKFLSFPLWSNLSGDFAAVADAACDVVVPHTNIGISRVFF